MADKVPVKGGYDGSSLTGLAEFASGDTLGIAHGGTGIATIGSNQLITGNGTSAVTSESNLTFDGTILKATGDLCATVKVVAPALCIGSEYVLPTSDGSAGQLICTDGSGALAFADAASSGHTIADEGTALASRTCLNFVGSAVTATDNSGSNATDVTVCATNALLKVREADGTQCCITLSSAAVGESLVSDTSPQLGGNLDVNGNSIVSASNGNIPITPNGSGIAIIDGICHPTADGSAGQVLCTNGSAALQWATVNTDLCSDTSPQLGGNLDVNGNSIISASNGNIPITPNGSGIVILDGICHPTADGSAGQVLCTNGSAALQWATVSAGVTLAGSTDNTIATVTGSNALCGEANLTFDGTTLTVGGVAALTSSQLTFADDGLVLWGSSNTANMRGKDGADGYLRFDTQATERMRLSASGQLLIGTDSSLGVSSGTGNGLQLAGDDTFANFAIHSHRENQYPGVFTMAHSRNATVGCYTILQDGDALGYIAFAGDDGTDVNSLGAEIWAEVDGTPGSNDMPGRLIFRTTADGAATTTERMRIKSTGLVGIGEDDPEAQLHVLQTGDDQIAMFRNSNGAGFSTNRAMVHIDFSAQAPDSTSYRFLQCEDSGAANRCIIYSDGTVSTAAGNSLASDERLKTNIVDASDKLADLMRLRVRNFEWTPEFHPAKVGEKKIGFIAQELETVFPSLIMEDDIARDNSIEEKLYDADDDTQYYVDGDDIPDGKAVGDVKTESQIPEGKAIGDIKVAAKAHEPTMRKSIKDAFAPILVKALQEVTVRLEAAEAKIAALEAA